MRLGFARGEQMEEIVFVFDGSVDNFNLVRSLRECEYLVGFLWETDCIEINYCFMLNYLTKHQKMWYNINVVIRSENKLKRRI